MSFEGASLGDYKMLMVKLDGKWYYIDVFSADYYSRTDCLLFGEDNLKSLYSFGDRDSVEYHYGYIIFIT